VYYKNPMGRNLQNEAKKYRVLRSLRNRLGEQRFGERALAIWSICEQVFSRVSSSALSGAIFHSTRQQ
jgi:hypothetical protein